MQKLCVRSAYTSWSISTWINTIKPMLLWTIRICNLFYKIHVDLMSKSHSQRWWSYVIKLCSKKSYTEKQISLFRNLFSFLLFIPFLFVDTRDSRISFIKFSLLSSAASLYEKNIVENDVFLNLLATPRLSACMHMILL